MFINSQDITESDFKSFDNMIHEHQMMNHLNNELIEKTLGIGYSFARNQSRLGLVLEVMDIDLNDFLRRNKGNNNSLKLNDQLEMAISISNAILFIHNKGFVHHDIKPSHILMRGKGENLEIKISDFGSCLKNGDNENNILNGITLNYASPENILHCCFGEQFFNHPKSDIWSLGIVFYRIFIENKNVLFPWSTNMRKSNGSFVQKMKRNCQS